MRWIFFNVDKREKSKRRLDLRWRRKRFLFKIFKITILQKKIYNYLLKIQLLLFYFLKFQNCDSLQIFRGALVIFNVSVYYKISIQNI
jgi:hypothetical protein